MTSFVDLPTHDQLSDIETLMQEIRTLLVANHLPDRLLSIKEACQMLNVSRSTLYKMMDSGELSYVERYGRHIPLSAALQWIKEHTTTSTARRR